MPMASTRKSLNKKRKDGVRNSTGTGGFVISNIGITIDTIRCSGCNRIPDQQIFNCLGKHLICDICETENGLCPLEKCNQKLVTATATEKLLANITFQCPWTTFGCNKANLQRHNLTSHMKTCEKNPGNLSCSKLFQNECDFQFCTRSADDDDGIKEIKEHLKSHQNEMSVSDTIHCSGRKKDEFLIAGLENKVYVTEVLDWKHDDEALGTLMIVWVAEMDTNEVKTISRYFVSLAENCSINSRFEVQMTIKSQPKPGRYISGKFIPDLKWHTIIQNTREFKDTLNLTPQERKQRNYSMSVSHLQEYYVNAQDQVNVEFSVLSADEKKKRRKTSINS